MSMTNYKERRTDDEKSRTKGRYLITNECWILGLVDSKSMWSINEKRKIINMKGWYAEYPKGY